MPSVGTSADGWTQRFRVAAVSLSADCGGLCQSTARSMVWTRLMIWTEGCAVSDLNRATTKRAPLFASVSMLVCAELPVVWLDSDRCQCEFTAGTGTHKVASAGASSSCTVV